MKSNRDKENKEPSKRTVGRPPFVPTDEDRAVVKLLVACGMSQDRVCLRITGNDGAIVRTDDVTITVTNPPPPQINSVDFVGSNPRSIRFAFNALGGMPYTVQYRDSLTTGSWQGMTNIPAQPATQPIQILDPLNSVSKTRFYRLSTP